MSATGITTTEATVQWGPATDPEDDPITYELQVRKNDLSDSWSSTISTTATSHTFTGLQPNTTYRARVRAFDGQFTGDWRHRDNFFTTGAEWDRGHRILIKRGLQIQALTFGTENASWWQNGLWGASNFTAPSFQARNPASQHIQPGQPWASWIADFNDPANSMPANATPYLSGLVSWSFADELDVGTPANRNKVKQWINKYRPLLPNTLLHTSEHGEQVSFEDMRTFMEVVKPDMVHFNAYPCLHDGWFSTPEGPRVVEITPWYMYWTMAKYRDLGLGGYDGTGNQPIPYGAWLQTFRFASSQPGEWSGQNYQPGDDFGFWLPSESEMRLSQFAAWTYGYKFVSAFTYNDVFESADVFIDSPFFNSLPTGPFHTTVNPSQELSRYAETNRQSLNLGPTLVRLLSTDVRFLPGAAWGSVEPINIPVQLPEAIDGWDAQADPYITAIEAENLGTENGGLYGDVLVGYFNPLLEEFDGPAFEDEIYFMITNGLAARDALVSETAQRITIDFDFGSSGINSLQRLSRQNGQVEVVSLDSLGGSLYQLVLEMEGGTGDLFKFNNGAPFVGIEASASAAKADGLQSDIRLLQGNHNVAPVTASVPQSSMIRDHQMISRLWSRLAPTWWFTFFGESESERFEKPPIGKRALDPVTEP